VPAPVGRVAGIGYNGGPRPGPQGAEAV
jgi:hypothetical protein